MLGGAQVGDLGDRVGELSRIGGALQMRDRELPVEAAPELAAVLLGEALLVTLEENGWTVTAPLGEPVAAVRGDDRLEPHQVVGELRTSGVDAAAWRERAAALGITDLPLIPAARVAA